MLTEGWQAGTMTGWKFYELSPQGKGLIHFEHVHVYDLSHPLFTQCFKNENAH
jgi:hypothetical protein